VVRADLGAAQAAEKVRDVGAVDFRPGDLRQGPTRSTGAALPPHSCCSALWQLARLPSGL